MGNTNEKEILNSINDLKDTNKSVRAIEKLAELCINEFSSKFERENKEYLIKNGGIHVLANLMDNEHIPDDVKCKAFDLIYYIFDMDI